MSLYGLSVFALVYMLAVASPGPGVAAIVARVLGRGLAVLPTVIELKRLTVGGFFEIALVICFVLPLVLGLYAFFAGRARKHLSRPESVRWVQRGTGAVMAGAAIAVATR
jgi:threonine/homoserine/homoserine lactone efflux protein